MERRPTDSADSALAVTLRPERVEDEAFLLAVYASTRAEELAAAGWDAATCALFVELQFRAMRQGYRAMFPEAENAIILADGRPVGRAVIDRSGDSLHLVDLALLAAERNRGIGTYLLREWTREAASDNRPVRLRVLKGSPARRLYERLGFLPIGDQGLHDCLEWQIRHPLPRAVAEGSASVGRQESEEA